MPRPRTNDPSNLPAAINLVSDPAREALLVVEFQKRLAYLKHSFLIGRAAHAGDNVAFNASLERLRRRLARKYPAKRRGDRIHPEIEMVISHHARAMANAENVAVSQRHIQLAAAKTVELLRPRRGRPDDAFLDLQVSGVMALAQEVTGRPVLARKCRDSVYDPHFADGVSQVVPLFFQDLDETLTVTRLVDSVRRIRKEYAGKPLRFSDLFPLYGASFDRDCGITLRRGYRLEAFEPNITIYCP